MEIGVSMLLFLMGIAALVVIHLCIVGRVFRGEMNSDGKIPGRISKEELQNLSSFNYSNTQESTSATATATGGCVVCLDMFSEGDKCRMLPNCNHTFHLHCIDSWLLKTAVCPMCRTTVCPPSVSVAIDIT